ncbi:MAG TPA: hypothetical protein ENH62_00890 [Marinobacter sp.]|uniref:Uncharacterized protein n=1 Tax=marine sediment metagenome TaxID=412755 RepID=A0A0F9TK47_9ZZZZ|nr:hypothetical protein [Marinobacter sp.]
MDGICDHRNFEANVNVARIEDVMEFMAEIKIKCADCGLDFHFKGVPMGMSYSHPMAEVGCTELRAPIAPGKKL